MVSPSPSDRSLISGVNVIYPLVAFYDIHVRKRGAILLFCLGHHTRLLRDDEYIFYILMIKLTNIRTFFSTIIITCKGRVKSGYI
jgi:hypothetical protein